MKRKSLKTIIIIIFTGICLTFFISRFNMGENRIIDMTGNNNMWRASLNMHMGYSNELLITLVAEEFEPPSEILVDILVKDKSVYNNKIKIGQDDFPHYGVYKCNFKSIKYMEKNHKNVSIFVNFNDETITIPLTLVKVIR